MSILDEMPEGTWDADWFYEAIRTARDMGYSQGYAEGQNDAELARVGDPGE
jgi:hypothetical protein